jgi:uncharacterized membrane protein YozB (DUF420 family)
MAEWLNEAGFFGTQATIGADLSQLMATLFPALFIIGWLQARHHNGHRHHWLMLGGVVTMLSFFTSYYLFRQLGVLALEGEEGFGGPQALYDHVFVPLLSVHIVLVTIGLVMAVYLIVLGFRAQTLVGRRRVLRDDRLVASWARMAVTFGSIAGVVVLLFVLRTIGSEFSVRKLAVYLGFLLLIAIVFAVETMIQRIWPDGGQRHRVLGRFTILIYCALFVTGGMTYTMLYILYPGKIGCLQC